ncbi:MAG TPA: sulfate adenylyltransferase subunit CysN [Polyangiaceae bacterium]|nr:sulfate adenylyltransferase subunit CysN [Polyangiaceae bacterium]
MAPETKEIEKDIEGYLARHERKELVRFVTVGSVDDGKSTLIGRLLHDSVGIYEDQMAAVKKASTKTDEEIDFSLFTDGLKAEREQGITIDVAYRYFSTETRKFIIADTPGHVQYTRNMATGASTADVAIILLDSRLGVLPQSRRHAYIASMLGIGQLIVAVNKMDLVDYAEGIFDKYRMEFGAFVSRLKFAGVHYLPISAKKGDNVVTRSAKTPWYAGGTLLELLETVPVARDRTAEALRYPVQSVIRPHLDYRGFAGQLASGVVRKGETVVILPSGKKSVVKSIDTHDGSLESAFAPQSVTLRLEDEVDVSRGDMIVRDGDLPRVARRFDAMMVWLSERAFDPQRALLLKHTARVVPARVERVQHRIDLETLDHAPSPGLVLNDIARVTLRCNRPIFCDAYDANRVTGAFILIDALSNDTVAAGMILAAESGDAGASGGEARGPVTAEERRERLGQSGAVLFVGEGHALGKQVERILFGQGLVAMSVDASELSEEGLREVAARCASLGIAVIVSGARDETMTAIAEKVGSGAVARREASAPAEELARALGSLCLGSTA